MSDLHTSRHTIYNRTRLEQMVRVAQAVGASIRTTHKEGGSGSDVWYVTVTYPQQTMPALLSARRSVNRAASGPEA